MKKEFLLLIVLVIIIICIICSLCVFKYREKFCFSGDSYKFCDDPKKRTFLYFDDQIERRNIGIMCPKISGTTPFYSSTINPNSLQISIANLLPFSVNVYHIYSKNGQEGYLGKLDAFKSLVFDKDNKGNPVIEGSILSVKKVGDLEDIMPPYKVRKGKRNFELGGTTFDRYGDTSYLSIGIQNPIPSLTFTNRFTRPINVYYKNKIIAKLPAYNPLTAPEYPEYLTSLGSLMCNAKYIDNNATGFNINDKLFVGFKGGKPFLSFTLCDKYIKNIYIGQIIANNEKM